MAFPLFLCKPKNRKSSFLFLKLFVTIVIKRTRCTSDAMDIKKSIVVFLLKG